MTSHAGMLCPQFDVRQDAQFVDVDVRLPYVKVSLIELDINGDTLELYARPYFLRLVLPGNIIEDGREYSEYDVDSQLLKIKLPKENPGEIFQGLELLTTLLPAAGPKKEMGGSRPLIEMIGDDAEPEEADEVIIHS